MKRFALAILALALISVLFGTPAVTHAAGAEASCWADKYELAQGDFTNVYCSGFSPLTMINVYYAEPDGTAVIYGNVKSDANGNIVFGWGNGFKGGFGFSYALGTYTIVAQQLGLAKQILVVGQVGIKNSGAGDHVSGASLTTDKARIDRSSETFTVTGSGFAPGEIVTVWLQTPPVCSSFTAHFVDGKNGKVFFNVPEYGDISTAGILDIKADASGSFSFLDGYFAAACEGTWRYAARGNTSGLGAYADIIVSGPAVSTNASLIPSKNSVGAFNDTIEFAASGFGANEILNCWTTSPDGRAIPYGIPGSFGNIKVGADGSGVISLTTGSVIFSKDDFSVFPNGLVEPVMSEGSIGVWSLTCKGLASGTTAIASYTVYGYETNP